MAMQNRLADDTILDKYSVDPVSRANFRRIWDDDTIPERDEFFAMCKRTETDEAALKQAHGVSSQLPRLLTRTDLE
jgi:hypothetical protein